MARPDEPPPRWGVAADALVVLRRRGADKAVVGQSPTVVGPTEPCRKGQKLVATEDMGHEAVDSDVGAGMPASCSGLKPASPC